jgi:hypothetical protein
MSVELREWASRQGAACPSPNRAKLNFEQGQVPAERRQHLLQMAQSFVRLADEAELLKSAEGEQSQSKTA